MDEAQAAELQALYNKGGLELRWVPPGSAQENPDQWKDHPPAQRQALREFIFGEDGVGWAGAGLINDRRVEDGWPEEEAVPTWLDGHAREAVSEEEDAVMPALVGHWNERDEKRIIAFLDPMKDMATIRPQVLAGLLDKVEGIPTSMRGLIEDMKARAALESALSDWKFEDDGFDAEAAADLAPKAAAFKVKVHDEGAFADVVTAVRNVINENGYDAEVTL